MNNRMLIIFLLIFTLSIITATSDARGAKPTTAVPGEFDYYVFSLSWQPAFCETKPEKNECKSQTTGRYDAANLVLHGLWPNKDGDKNHSYGYCSVKSSLRKLDKATSWCKMPSPTMTDNTKESLSKYMPGFSSCLERHEWYKHGTCSGLSADVYFETAYTLVAKVSETRFGHYISDHVGQTVKSDELLSEFENDFASSDYVALECEEINGISMLMEVRMFLKKDLNKKGNLKDMLFKPDNFEKGNCPQEFLIDKVHSYN